MLKIDTPVLTDSTSGNISNATVAIIVIASLLIGILVSNQIIKRLPKLDNNNDSL